MTEQWTIVSAYVGKKAQHQGLTFQTRVEFDTEAHADWYADILNAARQDRWPGHEFEFRVVPIKTEADTPE